jgi:flagellar hook protein FlgE
MTFNFNLLGSGGKPTITQVSSASTVTASTQDGYPSGQFQSFSVGADGTISATFSNFQQLTVGQLAMGNVANVQGLKLMGNGDYTATQASGTAAIGVSGAAGMGTMQDGALEASNVNISGEFSDLIIAQRAFEANSKAVTTFDTVVQETINMIH